MQELTPRQIVAELDKFIIGQAAAKRAVAIALRSRYRRRQLPRELRDEIIPKNILMIGPTGVGKTEIARRLARLASAPFVKVEATKFTEVGYVGRDVDSMVRDLMQISYQMVEAEKTADVRARAEESALERILDLLQPMPEINTYASAWGSSEPSQEERERSRKREDQALRIRSRLREQLQQGLLDDRKVELESEDSNLGPGAHVFMGQNPEDMFSNIQDALNNAIQGRRRTRSVRIAEAREILIQEEAKKLIDPDAVKREAVERAEQDGIIFVDEMDKIATPEGRLGADVSRGGVQRDILPIIEGSTVQTKFGAVRTDYILFIAAGAFHVAKPSDLIPELQGRLPIRVELENLTETDFRRILTEPENALTRQYSALLGTDQMELTFTEDGIDEIARTAAEVNRKTENIGARRLHTILERLLDEVSYDAPEGAGALTIDADYVRDRLSAIVENQDLSRFIL